ncbi:hypothetical protein NFJ02_35g87670 [Pycnococcus provasolii]
MALQAAPDAQPDAAQAQAQCPPPSFSIGHAPAADVSLPLLTATAASSVRASLAAAIREAASLSEDDENGSSSAHARSTLILNALDAARQRLLRLLVLLKSAEEHQDAVGEAPAPAPPTSSTRKRARGGAAAAAAAAAAEQKKQESRQQQQQQQQHLSPFAAAHAASVAAERAASAKHARTEAADALYYLYAAAESQFRAPVHDVPTALAVFLRRTAAATLPWSIRQHALPPPAHAHLPLRRRRPGAARDAVLAAAANVRARLVLDGELPRGCRLKPSPELPTSDDVLRDENIEIPCDVADATLVCPGVYEAVVYLMPRGDAGGTSFEASWAVKEVRLLTGSAVLSAASLASHANSLMRRAVTCLAAPPTSTTSSPDEAEAPSSSPPPLDHLTRMHLTVHGACLDIAFQALKSTLASLCYRADGVFTACATFVENDSPAAKLERVPDTIASLVDAGRWPSWEMSATRSTKSIDVTVWRDVPNPGDGAPWPPRVAIAVTKTLVSLEESPQGEGVDAAAEKKQRRRELRHVELALTAHVNDDALDDQMLLQGDGAAVLQETLRRAARRRLAPICEALRASMPAEAEGEGEVAVVEPQDQVEMKADVDDNEASPLLLWELPRIDVRWQRARASVTLIASSGAVRVKCALDPEDEERMRQCGLQGDMDAPLKAAADGLTEATTSVARSETVVDIWRTLGKLRALVTCAASAAEVQAASTNAVKALPASATRAAMSAIAARAKADDVVPFWGSSSSIPAAVVWLVPSTPPTPGLTWRRHDDAPITLPPKALVWTCLACICADGAREQAARHVVHVVTSPLGWHAAVPPRILHSAPAPVSDASMAARQLRAEVRLSWLSGVCACLEDLCHGSAACVIRQMSHTPPSDEDDVDVALSLGLRCEAYSMLHGMAAHLVPPASVDGALSWHVRLEHPGLRRVACAYGVPGLVRDDGTVDIPLDADDPPWDSRPPSDAAAAVLQASAFFSRVQGCASSALRHLKRIKSLPLSLGVVAESAGPSSHAWEAACRVSCRSDGPLRFLVGVGSGALDAASHARVVQASSSDSSIGDGVMRDSALRAVNVAVLAPCEVSFAWPAPSSGHVSIDCVDLAMTVSPSSVASALRRVQSYDMHACELARDGSGQLVVDALAASLPVLRVICAALDHRVDAALADLVDGGDLASVNALPSTSSVVVADGVYSFRVQLGESDCWMRVHALGGRRVGVGYVVPGKEDDAMLDMPVDVPIPESFRAACSSASLALEKLGYAGGISTDKYVWPTSFASLFEVVQVVYSCGVRAVLSS